MYLGLGIADYSGIHNDTQHDALMLSIAGVVQKFGFNGIVLQST